MIAVATATLVADKASSLTAKADSTTEWTEPPFGFSLPHDEAHAIEVLRSLPDRAGLHVFLRALLGNDYHR